MIRKLLILLLLFLCSIQAHAQEYEKSSLYFETNQYKLTQEQMSSLDSLLLVLNDNKHHLIEFYSSTDSVSTTKFNDQLSDSRNRSVYNYLRLKKPVGLQFNLIALGEDTSSISDAQKRRVDILIFPLDDEDQLEIKAENGISLKVSAAIFSGCGYAFSETSLTTTDFADGNDRRHLNLQCNSKCFADVTYQNCHKAEFVIPAAVFKENSVIKKITSVDDAEDIVQMPGIDLKDSLRPKSAANNYTTVFDSISNTFRIKIPCYTWKGIYGSCVVEVPCNPKIISLPWNLAPAYTRIDHGGDSMSIYSDTNSFYLSCQDNSFVVYSRGIMNGQFVFAEVKSQWIPHQPINDSMIRWYAIVQGKIPAEYYKPLPYEDIPINITVKRNLPVAGIGIYIEKYDYILTIPEGEKNLYSWKLPDFEYVFRITKADGSRIDVPFKAIKKHYSKKKGVLKMKIKKKNLIIH